MSGLGLTILSGLLILQDVRGRSSGAEPFVQVRQPIMAVLGLVAFVVLLDPLGYVLATAVLTTILLLVFKSRMGWGAALTILLLSVGSYLLFDRVLDVPLPEGVLGLAFGA
jgi:putative tricarboxylic transport membrane protein